LKREGLGVQPSPSAIVTLSKIAAPMIPFMTEQIYQNLVCTIDKTQPESVHLCDFPVADQNYIDKELEADMDEVLKIVTLGRAARNESGIKNRQPLSVMYVNSENELGDFYKEIIEDELNIKAVEFVKDMSRFTTYTFKPQLKTVGPKYGKFLGEIRNALAAVDGNAAKKELDETGKLTLVLSSATIELEETDLLIDSGKVEGFASFADGGYTVAIDTTLTEELIIEGFVREIISKIQTMRKDAGFEVVDRIKVGYKASDVIAKVIEKNKATISRDVLAVEIKDSLSGYEATWDINGNNVLLSVEKA
ncbi:MAG: class I tRNA ligase family protein, partial [Clostridia bacterium]|nr:class I tRNA ligase family protein [Clostridia bacterium]